jgi:hypothetical protein
VAGEWLWECGAGQGSVGAVLVVVPLVAVRRAARVGASRGGFEVLGLGGFPLLLLQG